MIKNYKGKLGYYEMVVTGEGNDEKNRDAKIKVFVDSDDFGGYPTLTIDLLSDLIEETNTECWYAVEMNLSCQVPLIREVAIKILTVMNTEFEDPEGELAEIYRVLQEFLGTEGR